MEHVNGDRTAWLRCYRCWSTRLEAQVHYDAIIQRTKLGCHGLKSFLIL